MDKANPETNHAESSGGIKTVQEADRYARGGNGAAQEANPRAQSIPAKQFRTEPSSQGRYYLSYSFNVQKTDSEGSR